MKIHVLTLFPDMITGGLKPGIIGRAVRNGILSLNVVNIRDYTLDKHGSVDDYPYGGGAGMLMQAQPVYDAWKAAVQGDGRDGRNVRTVYLTPQGIPFRQSMAQEFAGEEELVFLCGHYEGIDERVLDEIVTDFVSVGDYVLTGGELPAMVMIDAITRLIPGALGNESSAEEESFAYDLLEYPQYTRPEVWHGQKVPEALLSGNHKKVADWRREEAERRTRQRRPDMYARYRAKRELTDWLLRDKRNHIHMIESLCRGQGEILFFEGGNVLICDRKSKVSMVQAEDEGSAARLAAMVPEDTELVMSLQESVNRALEERGCLVECATGQYLYTERVPLPVRTNPGSRHIVIRKLGLEYLDHICERQSHDGRGYIRTCLELGNMYGAFADGKPEGFIGMRREGGIGFLYVDGTCRREGIAKALMAFMVNLNLKKGWTPYCHVLCGDEASERLQEKLGFYRAGKTVWWLSCPQIRR